MRGTRMRKRLLDEIDAVVIRNVENLRWATRQNLEDSFRRFGAELDERLAMSLAATRGAMQKALSNASNTLSRSIPRLKPSRQLCPDWRRSLKLWRIKKKHICNRLQS